MALPEEPARPLEEHDQQPPIVLVVQSRSHDLLALTNLRAVRDASSPTGWKVDIGPFPGWSDAPTW